MDIKLYTKTGCSRCVETKKLLQEHGYFYDEEIIGVDIDRQELLNRWPHLKVGDQKAPLILVDGHLRSVDELETLLGGVTQIDAG